MPVRTSLPLAAFVGLLATLAAGPAAAQGPGYIEAPPRFAPRPLPPPGFDRGYGPYAGRRAYGPVVRAYLPRNDSVPMYNEPPAR